MSHPEQRLEEGLRLQKSGRFDEALACYEAVEASGDPGLVAEALRRRAFIHHARSEWDQALAVAGRAARIASAAGLTEHLAGAMNAVASVHLARGEYDAAEELLQRILATTQELRTRGVAHQNLGFVWAQRADFATAKRHFMDAHRCFARAGLVWEEAYVLNNFGRAALDHANPRVAAPLLEDAVGAARRAQDLDLLALATLNQAEAIAGLGDHERADGLARRARDHFVATGNRWRTVECLRTIGDIAMKRGDRAAAAGSYEEGLSLARQIGASVEQALLEQRLAALRDPTSAS